MPLTNCGLTANTLYPGSTIWRPHSLVVQPISDGTVRIVIQTVHVRRVEAAIWQNRVPTLPDGGGAHLDLIEFQHSIRSFLLILQGNVSLALFYNFIIAKNQRRNISNFWSLFSFCDKARIFLPHFQQKWGDALYLTTNLLGMTVFLPNVPFCD